jgi:hypothetical protein
MQQKVGAALMGGSYKQCVECGKRALSIATRCPGCGREFPVPTPETSPSSVLDPSLLLRPRVVVGILAVAGALTAASLGRTSLPPEGRSSFEAGEQSSFVVDTNLAAGEVGYANVVTPAESAGELLVARDWSSVRKGRSRRTDLQAVLMPGDTVQADSLERGWYRVALDGEVLGYVHRSRLIPLQGPLQ